MKAAAAIVLVGLVGLLANSRPAAALPTASELARQLKARHQTAVTLQELRDLYLKPLQERGAPVSFAQCWQAKAETWSGLKPSPGRIKIAAIIPQAAKHGLIIALYFSGKKDGDPVVRNFADFQVKPQFAVSSAFTGDRWVVSELAYDATYVSLSKQFESIPLRDIDARIASEPKAVCAAYDGSLVADSAPAGDKDYDRGYLNARGFVDFTMKPLREQNIPVYFAECAEPAVQAGPGRREKTMIIFPKGESRGKILTISQPVHGKETEQWAGHIFNIDLKSRVEIESDGTNRWTRMSEQLTAESLVRGGARLIAPKNFMSILSSTPKKICPDWPLGSADAKTLDKYYKDNAWQSPPHI